LCARRDPEDVLQVGGEPRPTRRDKFTGVEVEAREHGLSLHRGAHARSVAREPDDVGQRIGTHLAFGPRGSAVSGREIHVRNPAITNPALLLGRYILKAPHFSMLPRT